MEDSMQKVNENEDQVLGKMTLEIQDIGSYRSKLTDRALHSMQTSKAMTCRL
jgi:hypothetical protein